MTSIVSVSTQHNDEMINGGDTVFFSNDKDNSWQAAQEPPCDYELCDGFCYFFHNTQRTQQYHTPNAHTNTNTTSHKSTAEERSNFAASKEDSFKPHPDSNHSIVS